MPVYEYECKDCGVFEAWQKLSDNKIEVCPTCGKPVIRILSSSLFKFNGPGFYATDYAKKQTKVESE